MSKTRTVENPDQLLPYLFASWPEAKRKQVRTWLKFQSVTVNGRPVSQFNHPLVRGDIKICFEDASIIVIDKPANLLSIATETEQEKTAYFQLTEYLRRGNEMSRDRVWIVHRLDRETSGLMVFAKSPQAKAALQTGWEKAVKRYEAVVEGKLKSESGVLASDLDESHPLRVYSAPPSESTRHAVTHYRVLARREWRTLVELTLETGRRHQIRVQLADAGCPIVGDEKYGAKSDPAKRLGLHACGLRFPHPETGREMKFESPTPKDLLRLV